MWENIFTQFVWPRISIRIYTQNNSATIFTKYSEDISKKRKNYILLFKRRNTLGLIFTQQPWHPICILVPIQLPAYCLESNGGWLMSWGPCTHARDGKWGPAKSLILVDAAPTIVMDIWELIHQMEDLFVFVVVVVVDVLVSVGIEEFCNKNKMIFFKWKYLWQTYLL